MKRTFPIRLVASFLVLTSAALAAADNWPQWRGPTNDGIGTETGLPVKWGESENIAWKLPLPGKGGSTPVVWGDRIFLTTADDNDLLLFCISTDGKLLWKRPLGKGDRSYFRGEGNNVSASPSTDGKHVYTFMGTGDFACHDFEGKEVWHFNAQDRYGAFRIMHGMHVTPLLHGDRLYHALLHDNAMWVIALDKATGKEIWKADRPTDGFFEGRHSYASPCMWQKGKEAYLVVHGCDYATAHSLEDGKEIWRLQDLNPKDRYNRTLRFVASPVASEDLIVVPTAKGGPVVGVKPEARGTIKAGSDSEQWRMGRGTPDVPSPLIHDGLVYLCGEFGTLTCLDARTGKQYYHEALRRARYRASPVLADGKVYLTGTDGTFTVVKAGKEYERLEENRLPDTFSSSPAISNGRIYLRGWDALYAVGTEKK